MLHLCDADPSLVFCCTAQTARGSKVAMLWVPSVNGVFVSFVDLTVKSTHYIIKNRGRPEDPITAKGLCNWSDMYSWPEPYALCTSNHCGYDRHGNYYLYNLRHNLRYPLVCSSGLPRITHALVWFPKLLCTRKRTVGSLSRVIFADKNFQLRTSTCSSIISPPCWTVRQSSIFLK